jgi:DNA gyrase subunit A
MTAGKRMALDRYEGDYVQRAFVASTDDTLLVFSDDGKAYGLPVRDVPETGLTSRGKALSQLFEMGRRAGVAGVQVVGEWRADRWVLFATSDGTVKRTALDQYANARAGGIDAVKLTGDRVVDVRVTDGKGDVVLVGRGGRAIRFPEADVPVMGRVAQGVRGIRLKDGEAVVGMAVARRDAGELMVVTQRGWGRRLALEELAPQGRGGLGTVLLAPTKETGDVAAAREVHPGEDLMAVTAVGRTLRLKPESVEKTARGGAASKVVDISAHDRIVDVTHVAERELPESAAGAEPADDDGGFSGDESPDASASFPEPSSNGSSPHPPEDGGDGELDLFT